MAGHGLILAALAWLATGATKLALTTGLASLIDALRKDTGVDGTVGAASKVSVQSISTSCHSISIYLSAFKSNVKSRPSQPQERVTIQEKKDRYKGGNM